MAAPIITRMVNGEGISQRGGQPTYGRLTKLEFPKFSGENVQGWLYKVNRNQEEIDLVNEDPMMELKNLKQVGSVQAYQYQFEALLTKVDQPEACHKYTPLLYTPKNVVTPFVPKSGGYGTKVNNLALPAIPQTIGSSRPRKQLTQQEMAEKRVKHLCFYCDQRYSPGHKCSGQMYCLEVIGYDEIIKDEDGVISEQELVPDIEVEEETMPQVSLNAMNGVKSYQTMRVRGHVGKQVLHNLIDCGSTHNFLDLQAAKRLGCRTSKICPLQVSVANGQVMSSVYECKNFKWSLQGQVFETDVMILPLGRCEMVLGIQWLATLGKIQCDFKNLVMEFVVKGQRCILRGTTQSVLQWMQGRHVSSSLNQIGTEISSMAMCIYPATSMQLSGKNTQSKPQIQTLLKEFTIVFTEPKGLPPNRSHDHTIPLAPNATPINIRPYKHPPVQKDAIELMVKELLEARTIRNS
ncbi:hypothetical protein Tco_1253838 [Tanacetum coccineum]